MQAKDSVNTYNAAGGSGLVYLILFGVDVAGYPEESQFSTNITEIDE